MVSREHRIRHRKDFLMCYSKGKKHISKHCIFFVYKTSYPLWRLGITVTKKVGNAVLRNKFRRIIRACFNKYSELLPEGYDIVIVSRNILDKSNLCVAFFDKEILNFLSHYVYNSKKYHENT